MVELMRGLPPALQALVATIFTWFMTALGAGMVFFTKEVNRKLLDTMLGFSGGVMIAASYWSLLAPAIEISESMNVPSWLPPATGFLLGGVFLWGIDRILPHLHLGFPMEEAEGIKTNLKRTTLLVLAITIHNIPEGLAIGVAFGALASNMEFTTLVGAISLAVGIGIQNFPEGLAVSMPLRREGLSVFKSFWYGQLSGVVEPIASILGALTVTASHAILPYALSFAAGAMIYVTVEELIPESQRSGNTDLATLGLMLGFTTMMILDVTFS